MPDFCVARRAEVCLVFHASFSGAETVDFSQEDNSESVFLRRVRGFSILSDSENVAEARSLVFDFRQVGKFRTALACVVCVRIPRFEVIHDSQQIAFSTG